MKVSIQRWGNSLALRIPKAIAVESGLLDGASVDLKLIKGRIVLTPERVQPHNLHELLSQVTPENLHGEIETGRPIGRESW